MRMFELEVKDTATTDRFDVSCELKLASNEGTETPGLIEGYASVFALLDRGGDIVQPGAFKKSLAEWKKLKKLPPMLWQHDPDTPIGVWTEIAEDEGGLKVKGELVLDVPQAAVAHALLKRGGIGGLSIGYRTQDYDYDRTTGARLLKRLSLWEVSLVTIPMLPEAQISSVKSGALPSEREIEQALRDGGLSSRDAKIGVAAFKKVLREAGQPEPALREGAADALMSMRKLAKAISG